MQLKKWSKNKLTSFSLYTCMLIVKCCVYISAKPMSWCTQTGPWLYCCYLLLCLPTAAKPLHCGYQCCIQYSAISSASAPNPDCFRHYQVLIGTYMYMSRSTTCQPFSNDGLCDPLCTVLSVVFLISSTLSLFSSCRRYMPQVVSAMCSDTDIQLAC